MIQPSYPIKKHDNGLISVFQYTFGNLTLSYNPDDNRFHISKPDFCSIATFASNKKGYSNALYWIKRKAAK